MMLCPICNRSGHPVLIWHDDGWQGCVQADEKWHFGIVKQNTQADVLQGLEEMSGKRFGK